MGLVLGWRRDYHPERPDDGVLPVRSEKSTRPAYFGYQGRQLTKIESVASERHVQRMVALTEETPIDLERGRLVIPSNVDAQTFIPTGGKVEKMRAC
jgi:hypothetical protein